MPNPKEIRKSETGKGFPLAALDGSAEESRLAAFVSNLRHFFTKPQKTPHAIAEAALFSAEGFGSGVKDNFREVLKAGPAGPVDSRLLTNWSGDFSGFWQNLRQFVFVRAGRLGPDAESVLEIWSKNPRFTRVQAFSVAIHVALIALLISPLLPVLRSPGNTKQSRPDMAVTFSPFHLTAPPAKALTGGGSSRDTARSDHGRAPKFAATQFAAPLSHPVVNPRIAMTATVLGNSAIKLPNVIAANWGNPLSNLLGNSLGANGGNGIGDGLGNGLGKGGPYGSGEAGPPAGYGGYGSPECIYCPNAQFSEEAIRAKHQGVVLVDALITPDGRATDIRVIKSLGLGLGENAVAAVKTWRFKPANGPDGKPAAVLQTIEVEFRLI